MKKYPNTYTVLVANMGQVWRGHNKELATREFNAHVHWSKAPHGRSAGERVVLMKNGEPVREYDPSAKKKRDPLRRVRAPYSQSYIENEILALAPVPYKDNAVFAIKIENRNAPYDSRQHATRWVNITGWQMKRIERILLDGNKSSVCRGIQTQNEEIGK